MPARRWRPSAAWATASPMADGARIDPRDDDAEQAARAEDGRLIRRVRWRLVAWSGFTTLVVLVVLGAALYAVVAGSLAGASVEQLDARVEPWVERLTGTRPDDEDGPAFGFQPGAGNTFLFAFDDGGAPVQLGRERVVVLDGMPDNAEPRRRPVGRRTGATCARSTSPYGPTTFPARLLTQRVTYIQDGQTYFLQALQDRSTEVATLQSLLVTLLVGGIVVVLVAFAVGAVYASRALVPIRQSLEAQRVALRRQREFAADASHELRTPLTVIRSSVEHLQRHQDRPVAASVDALEDIDAEVDPPHRARRRPAAARPVGLGRRRARHADDGPRRRRVRCGGSFGRAAEARGVRVVVDPGAGR